MFALRMAIKKENMKNNKENMNSNLEYENVVFLE